jgi:uncharacterized membrane protein YvlD (DUF360 family)
MVGVNYIAGIGYVGFFKFFTPLLFSFSYIIVLFLCEKITDKRWVCLSYLLIIAAPVLSIMNEGVRPETFIFVLSAPILVLLYYSLQVDNYSYLFLAFLYAVTSLRFHELGIFLLMSTILSVFIALYRKRNLILSYFKKYPFYSLIILLPYFLVIKNELPMITGILKKSLIGPMAYQFIVKLFDPHWRWWFLNGYTGIDGGRISWQGISVVYYYLYNGILLILFFVLILISLYKQKKEKIPGA